MYREGGGEESFSSVVGSRGGEGHMVCCSIVKETEA